MFGGESNLQRFMLQQLGIDPKFILVMAVGFVLLFLLLKKFAFGPIFGVLQQRQDKIRGDLDEAEARRNEMLALQRDYETRLAKIEEEARDKIQAAVKEAQAARDEIIAKAQADREAIVRRGEQELASAREKAMVELRDQIANLATSGAERILKEQLNTQNHSRLIDDVIAGIGPTGSSNGVPQGGLR
jgi:F-type H+-transporting ATPase subunit b